MKEKYSKFVALVECLNGLRGQLYTNPRFIFEFIDSHMYIYGSAVDVVELYSLLRSNCEDYILCINHDDRGVFLTVFLIDA